MAALYSQQRICFASEDSFNDQSEETMDFRMPIVDVSFNLQGGRSTSMARQKELYNTDPGYLLPRSDGRIRIQFLLCGANADTATGSLVQTAQHKLIADALGGSDLTGVGGVAGASATATSLPNATGTHPRGTIIRVGQAGDGACEGQPTVIGATASALVTGLPASPGATDKLRASLMAYATETLGASKRFLVGFEHDAEMQFLFTGCHCSSMSIVFGSGDVAMVTLEYMYAHWKKPDTSDLAFALAMEECEAHINAGGSNFWQNRGTATRATEPESKAELTFNFGLQPEKGNVPGLSLCNTTGYVRTKAPNTPAATLRITGQWAQTRLDEYGSDGGDTIHKHWLWGNSAGEGTADTEGRHWSCYAPDLFPIETPPTPEPWNDLPYEGSFYALREGPDTTTAMSKSFFRIAFH